MSLQADAFLGPPKDAPNERVPSTALTEPIGISESVESVEMHLATLPPPSLRELLGRRRNEEWARQTTTSAQVISSPRIEILELEATCSPAVDCLVHV